MATSPDKWNEVKEWFEAALDQDPDCRSSFLQSHCADPHVRAEVERLLAEHELAHTFLSTPVADILQNEAERSQATSQTLTAGEMLAGRYRIVSFIASGGMGVVYKAEDTRLKRFVALKLLPNTLAREPQALARFHREGQAASALNHPNICTIYDIGEHDGHPFIAMEFLEGVNLKRRIAGRFLEVGVLLELAIDIAAGLESAHCAGIIHRDIKPSNIFVTKYAHAKLLDFGVAKMPGARRFSIEMANASTQSDSMDYETLTHPGSIVGTIAYMSPEQLEGKILDSRTDLFSFGVVLYEMATGLLPFRGESTALLLKAILDQTPAPAAHSNPDAPIPLQAILNKCLEKDRGLRYQTASDIRADLQRLKRDREAGVVSSATVPSAERVLQAAAPKESAVGRAAEVVAMVSETDSSGLKQYLNDEGTQSLTAKEVRERPFLLEFPTDAFGAPQPAEISLRLQSPDFEPASQTKKLRVPPRGDSAPCTFLIRPTMAGDLVANLELLKGDEVIVSRAIRTRAFGEGAVTGAGRSIVSIPLTIFVQQLPAHAIVMPTVLPELKGQPEISPVQPVPGTPDAPRAPSQPQSFTAFFRGQPQLDPERIREQGASAAPTFTTLFGDAKPSARHKLGRIAPPPGVDTTGEFQAGSSEFGVPSAARESTPLRGASLPPEILTNLEPQTTVPDQKVPVSGSGYSSVTKHSWIGVGSALVVACCAIGAVLLLVIPRSPRTAGRLAGPIPPEHMQSAPARADHPPPDEHPEDHVAQLEPAPALQLTLDSGLARGGHGREAVLVLQPSMNQALLHLRMEAEDYAVYQAILETVAGQEIQKTTNLTARTRSGQTMVNLRVPVRLIPPGDYVITLTGSKDSHGTDAELVETFTFRTAKP